MFVNIWSNVKILEYQKKKKMQELFKHISTGIIYIYSMAQWF